MGYSVIMRMSNELLCWFSKASADIPHIILKILKTVIVITYTVDGLTEDGALL